MKDTILPDYIYSLHGIKVLPSKYGNSFYQILIYVTVIAIPSALAYMALHDSRIDIEIILRFFFILMGILLVGNFILRHQRYKKSYANIPILYSGFLIFILGFIFRRIMGKCTCKSLSIFQILNRSVLVVIILFGCYRYCLNSSYCNKEIIMALTVIPAYLLYVGGIFLTSLSIILEFVLDIIRIIKNRKL